MQSIMKEYLTWFAIFHLIAKHCEKDLDTIFYFKGIQNFIEEPNGREFYKISDCGLHDEFLDTPLNYAYIDFLQRYEHLIQICNWNKCLNSLIANCCTNGGK